MSVANHSPLYLSSSALTPPSGQSQSSTSNLNDPSKFVFPRHYHFPPFFTRQTQSTTFHAQCSKWSNLILGYCRAHKIWKLSLVDAIDTELFWNKRISKRLAINDVKEVIDFMVREGQAEWIGRAGGEEKTMAWIWWRNPEEWAAAIVDWVSVLRAG